jgi:hypothetical protein
LGRTPPVEAHHEPAPAHDLFQLGEHLGKGHRQPPGLARGKTDRLPGVIDHEGVVPTRFSQVAADVVTLGHGRLPPVGDEVVVDVEHVGLALVGVEHRLGEGGLGLHQVRCLSQRLQTLPQGAQVRKGLGPEQCSGISAHQVLGRLHRAGAQREGKGGQKHQRCRVVAPCGTRRQRREDLVCTQPGEGGVQEHRPRVAKGDLDLTETLQWAGWDVILTTGSHLDRWRASTRVVLATRLVPEVGDHIVRLKVDSVRHWLVIDTGVELVAIEERITAERQVGSCGVCHRSQPPADRADVDSEVLGDLRVGHALLRHSGCSEQFGWREGTMASAWPHQSFGPTVLRSRAQHRDVLACEAEARPHRRTLVASIGERDDRQVPHADVAPVVTGEQVRTPEDEDFSFSFDALEPPRLRHASQPLNHRCFHYASSARSKKSRLHSRQPKSDEVPGSSYCTGLLPEV